MRGRPERQVREATRETHRPSSGGAPSRPHTREIAAVTRARESISTEGASAGHVYNSMYGHGQPVARWLRRRLLCAVLIGSALRY